MTSVSKRHHYIPQFFIKGFADDDGFLWVYDKKNDIILKDKKSPKSVFFAEDINTIAIGDKTIDLIEQFYSQSDNYFAKKINSIRGDLVDKIETNENASVLDVFIMFLFWRRYPNNYEVNRDASLLIESIDSLIRFENTSIGKHISIEDLKKLKKSMVSFSILKKNEYKLGENKKGFYKILNFREPFYFISDNPIIFDVLPTSTQNLIDSFKIFPVSKYRIYLSLKNKDYTMTIEQSKLINLLLIHQADKYVGSFSKIYLSEFVNAYRELSKKEGIFDHLKSRVIEDINK